MESDVYDSNIGSLTNQLVTGSNLSTTSSYSAPSVRRYVGAGHPPDQDDVYTVLTGVTKT